MMGIKRYRWLLLILPFFALGVWVYSARLVNSPKPIFVEGSINPKKVASGDTVVVIAKITDKFGLKKVTVNMGEIETITLNLQSGDSRSGTWEGKWKAHDTKVQAYQAIISATNILGKQQTFSMPWYDPSVADTFSDETKIASSANIAVAGGQVMLSIPTATPTLTPTPTPSPCGAPTVDFTYKGEPVTYGTVSSQGECWLDRNLGAAQVATAFDDADAYGDLFQWGRLDDGHQTRTSGTSTTRSSTDNPGHSNFIKYSFSPYDWREPQNNDLWLGVSGTNNPCPSGWRIPTNTEWGTEEASWAEQNYNGAYASPLKLTAGGYRVYNSASLANVGINGAYWSSVLAPSAYRLFFTGSTSVVSSYRRASGYSVRCIQD